MSVRHMIPNLFTLGNLLSGVIGIAATAFHGMPEVGGLCILIGAFLDLFDGAAARALKASSPIGAQLDSLADLVTFGVLPGMLAYTYIPVVIHGAQLDAWLPSWSRFIGFAIPLAAAWRLAVFNVDDSQSTTFRGLPSPANGIFWASIPLMLFASTAKGVFCLRAKYLGGRTEFELRDFSGHPNPAQSLTEIKAQLAESSQYCDVEPWWSLLSHGSFTLALALLTSLLMVSRIEMLSFKMKRGTRRPLYVLIALSVVVFAVFSIVYQNPFAAIPIVLLLYLLISIITNVRPPRHAVQSRD